MGENRENNNSNEWKCVDNSNDNDPGELKKILLIFLLLVILVGAGVGGMKLYQNINKDKEVSEEKKEVAVTPVVKEEAKKEDNIIVAKLSKEEMYIYIHEMANTIIVPGDGKIIGTKRITQSNIERALAEAKERDEYIFEEVSKWQQGEFENAIEVHNYVWAKLGGTIGKAVSLNNDEIEKVIKAFE